VRQKSSAMGTISEGESSQEWASFGFIFELALYEAGPASKEGNTPETKACCQKECECGARKQKLDWWYAFAG